MYTIDYFIKKFKSIPDSRWCTNTYESSIESPSKYCALGHCGARAGRYNEPIHSEESQSLHNLIVTLTQTEDYLTKVNDGNNPLYQQDTPKQRVLAALKWLKKEIK